MLGGTAAPPRLRSPTLPRLPPWALRRPELVLAPALLLAVLLAFELLAAAELVSHFILPAPSQVLRSLAALLGRAGFSAHLLTTLGEAAAGLGIALAAGLAVGTLVAEFRVVERTLYPLLVALQTMPKVALAPLLVVWFGFGPSSKVAVAAIIAFFPVLVTTIAGLRGTEEGRLDVLRALGAGRLRCLWLLRLPGAMPHLFAGLSIAVMFALTGAIVGEFVSASAGLGYLIIQANSRMDIPQVFALLLILGAISALAYGLVQALRQRVLFWAPQTEIHRP